MNCSGFRFGECARIASAYSNMHRKPLITESCCGKKNRRQRNTIREYSEEGCNSENAITVAARNTRLRRKLRESVNHRKIANRKKSVTDMFEHGKIRRGKPLAKKNKATPITTGYCITDGEKTLCTNDKNESYFNRRGIVGETRVYESAIDALKDVKKVRKQRKAKNRYSVRKCGLVGESFKFVNRIPMVNEGWFDGLTDAVGGALGTVGNTLKSAGNLATGDFSGAWDNLKDAGSSLKKATVDPITKVGSAAAGVAGDAVGGALGTVGNTLKSAGNLATGDFSGAWDNLKDAGSSLGDTIGGAIGKPLKSVGNFITGDSSNSSQQQSQNAQAQQKSQNAQAQQKSQNAQAQQQSQNAQAQQQSQNAQAQQQSQNAQAQQNDEAESIKKQIAELQKKLQSLGSTTPMSLGSQL